MTVGWTEIYPAGAMDAISASEYSVLKRLIEREGRLPAVWWRRPAFSSSAERPEAVWIGSYPDREEPHIRMEYDYDVRPGWEIRFRDHKAYVRWARRRFPDRLVLSWYMSPLTSLSMIVAEAFDPRLPYRERHPDLLAEVHNIETLRALA